ncbi:hypothetical protein [Inconstantimicrobium mannanitabidum]|uniref:Uncharacterized protein n=1 Tax=Inconstantimicrobium mannanitabidum TaxID=1604901 RepID=A0ACB5RDA8_9CLOT|nr:hypothetical protein [Clostridium sp. TW13]GKX67033.1 hypothetical protein rsdtw13_22910 [Clostridium sp. TW13]
MKKKRSLSIIMSLVMLFTLIIAPVSAKAETAKVYVRVEGLTQTIAEGYEDSTNALDAFEKLLKEKNIPYVVQDGQYGKYLSEVNGIKAGAMGGYDGWLYAVKDSKSIASGDVGIGSKTLKSGEGLVVYYGDFDKTAIVNNVTFSPAVPKAGEETTITLQNKSLDWNTNKEVVKAIKAATVEIDGKTYKTDDNGSIKLTLDKGTHDYKFSGYVDSKHVPTVLMDKGTFVLDGVNAPSIMYSDVNYNKVIDNTKVQKNIKETLAQTLTYVSKGKASNWAAFSLYKSNAKINEGFIDKLNESLKAGMDDMTPTELESAIVGVSALGYSPYDFNGQNLVKALFNKDINEYLNNDVIFGLLTYSSVNLPEEYKVKKSDLVNKLLAAYKKGWSWSGTGVDPDITAAAINALAPYYNGEKLQGVDNVKVKSIVNEAVSILSKAQLEDGNISGTYGASSETNAFVIMALTSIGVDPSEGAFAKSKGDLVSAFLSYKGDNGAFNHDASLKNNAYATEQALRALIVLDNFKSGATYNYYTSDINAKELKAYVVKNTDSKGTATTNTTVTNKNTTSKIAELPETGSPVDTTLLLVLAIGSIVAGVKIKRGA